MISFAEIWQQLLATSWLEWLAVALAIGYLVLAAHQSLWCWYAAAISCVIYTQLMFGAQLYMESALQLIYVALAAYGWWQWRYGRGQDDATEVQEYSWQWHLQWLVGLAVVAAGIAYLLQTYTDADAVWLDSYTTVYSLFATWLLTRKQFANWWYWLVIDAIYVYLYSSKGFVVTGGLYFVYLILVVYAMRQWQTTQVDSKQCENSG
ncbi:nicotinamide riboside transporter PnuC [Pseudidiomarina terrestris]|uniref:nicotinamide riboside transporter PnuC n=1 Tax=Pseudidiomarina terrestris TaxID=2820060 RepID=UPI002651B52C|nr:nicotinamide riboside transporter PnuC [Pseudidiomarina sp. 1ASP75-5]MDN7135877.1 nicotinamide mononucleotide transporter [Pseudidiomarina sp. 1ASP75-5]